MYTIKMQSLWFSKSLYRFFLLFLLLAFPHYTDGNQSSPQSSRSLKAMSTLTQLDFNHLEFVILTPPEYRDRLTERFFEKLTDAGLYDPNRVLPDSEKNPTLRLTLLVNQLDDICSGKVLYWKKIELVEEVIIKRNPNLHPQRVTWFYGAEFAGISNPISIQTLEADLDELVKQFIFDYKLGNPTMKAK